MALTRARPVGGSDQLRAELSTIVAGILDRPREPTKLLNDVLAMRAEIAQHKAPRGPLDVKLQRGGLVDIEFIVHFLQLRDRTALVPDLSDAIDRLGKAGLVGPGLADVHALLTATLVAARLIAPDLAVPHVGAAEALARICGFASIAAHLEALEQGRQMVAAEWRKVFAEQLEIE